MRSKELRASEDMQEAAGNGIRQKEARIKRILGLRTIGYKLGFQVRLSSGFDGRETYVCHNRRLDIGFETDCVSDAAAEMQRIVDKHNPNKAKPFGIKLLMMNQDGHLIDEYNMAIADDENPLVHMLYAPIVDWVRRSLQAGAAMHDTGRINRMPKLRRCEGMREDLFTLRRKLYQATHKPFAKEDRADIWVSVEQVLKIAEEGLR